MIEARTPSAACVASDCTSCRGSKKAPIATIVVFGDLDQGGVHVVLCQECGRDAANAIGFMCVREGGWSKLEPRNRKRAPREG